MVTLRRRRRPGARRDRGRVHSEPWLVSWPSPTRRAASAKTTTVHTLGAALAELGERVLLVDLDPQACLTYSARSRPRGARAARSTTCCRAGRRRRRRGRRRHRRGAARRRSTSRAPRCTCSTRTGREHALARALEPLRDRFDIVLIDCPPSLGILTINGLTAADEVAHPAAVRDAQPPRCRAAARDGRRRPRVHEARPAACAASSRRCSTAGPATPARCSPTCDDALRARRARTADPQVDPLRRGPGDRAVDPRTRAELAGRGRLPAARARPLQRAA